MVLRLNYEMPSQTQSKLDRLCILHAGRAGIVSVKTHRYFIATPLQFIGRNEICARSEDLLLLFKQLYGLFLSSSRQSEQNPGEDQRLHFHFSIGIPIWFGPSNCYTNYS